MINHTHLACFTRFAILIGGIILSQAVSAMPIPLATYNFDDTLAAEEAGKPDLTAIDPLGQNGFLTDTVFGDIRRVYRFDGNQTPAEQAGLVVDTTSILNSDDAYSVEMVFQFESNQSSWENIFGVSNRQSDNAFYVSPSDSLQVWPTGGGPTPFSFGQYHHVTLTNDGSNQVTAYLDGLFQFDLTTSSMNFSSYIGDNPNRLMHFFADNLIGPGQNEFADGRVSLIRLYDFELSTQDVADLGNDPFFNGPTIPEPGTLALIGLGLAGFSYARKRKA